jgi:hypothetical protein
MKIRLKTLFPLNPTQQHLGKIYASVCLFFSSLNLEWDKAGTRVFFLFECSVPGPLSNSIHQHAFAGFNFLCFAVVSQRTATTFALNITHQFINQAMHNARVFSTPLTFPSLYPADSNGLRPATRHLLSSIHPPFLSDPKQHI